MNNEEISLWIPEKICDFKNFKTINDITYQNVLEFSCSTTGKTNAYFTYVLIKELFKLNRHIDIWLMKGPVQLSLWIKSTYGKIKNDFELKYCHRRYDNDFSRGKLEQLHPLIEDCRYRVDLCYDDLDLRFIFKPRSEQQLYKLIDFNYHYNDYVFNMILYDVKNIFALNKFRSLFWHQFYESDKRWVFNETYKQIS